MTFPALYTIASYRQNGVVILRTNDTNIDGNQGVGIGMPNELDVVYILEVHVRVLNIATLQALPEQKGPLVLVLDAAGTVLDAVGTSRWVEANLLTLAAQVVPDAAALWSKGELLHIQYQEVDTNATPTADVEYIVRVQTLAPKGIVEGAYLLTS